MAESVKLLEEQSVSKYVYLTEKSFFPFVSLIVVWAQCFASTGQARHFPQVYCIYDMSSNRFVRHYKTNIDLVTKFCFIQFPTVANQLNQLS